MCCWLSFVEVYTEWATDSILTLVCNSRQRSNVTQAGLICLLVTLNLSSCFCTLLGTGGFVVVGPPVNYWCHLEKLIVPNESLQWEGGLTWDPPSCCKRPKVIVCASKPRERGCYSHEAVILKFKLIQIKLCHLYSHIQCIFFHVHLITIIITALSSSPNHL